MVTEAIILAGGFGSRLSSLISNIPKPMAVLNNKPFLEYQLDYLIDNGISRVIISVGYKKEVIIDYFADNYKSLEIIYSKEDEPLGTGGAIKYAIERVKGNLTYIINGDTFFKLDLKKMLQFHDNNNSFFTIAIKEQEKTKSYGNLVLNKNMRIVDFEEKVAISRYINGGVYLVEKDTFKQLNSPNTFSIEKDFFPKYVKSKNFYGYLSKNYFVDIGTPNRFVQADKQFSKIFDHKNK